MKRQPTLLVVSAVSLVLFTLFSACEISSGDDVIRDVPLNVAGTYVNANGIPRRQSGRKITSFNLSQTGDQLYVMDNEGARWTGSIGRVSGNSATFTLKGLTTDRNEVVITGTIRVEGTTGRMTGTWVEPGFTSEISAEAGIAPQPEPTPTPGNGGNGGGTTPENGGGTTPGNGGGTTPTPTPVPSNGTNGDSTTPPIVFPPLPG